MSLVLNMLREKNNPLISVIIPCYNAEEFVDLAVRSIMKQTYSNLEIIVLDDCSTDRTGLILENLANEDERIVYIRNASNLKLIRTLNKGLDIAKGEYIARMDADDISLPYRFQKQLDFFLKNPDYGVVGSCGLYLKNKKIGKKFIKPKDDSKIRDELYIDSPFIHPSVMIRREVFSQYDFTFHQVEDFGLWVKLSKVTKFYNLPDVLIHYRILETSETRQSQANSQGRHDVLRRVYKYLFETNNQSLSDEEINQYTYSMYRSNFSKVNPYILKDAYEKILSDSSWYLKKRLSERWFATLILSKRTIKEWFFYLITPFTYLGAVRVLFKYIRNAFS